MVRFLTLLLVFNLCFQLLKWALTTPKFKSNDKIPKVFVLAEANSLLKHCCNTWHFWNVSSIISTLLWSCVYVCFPTSLANTTFTCANKRHWRFGQFQSGLGSFTERVAFHTCSFPPFLTPSFFTVFQRPYFYLQWPMTSDDVPNRSIDGKNRPQAFRGCLNGLCRRTKLWQGQDNGSQWGLADQSWARSKRHRTLKEQELQQMS